MTLLGDIDRRRRLEKIRGKSSPSTRGRSVASLRAPTQLGLDFAQAEAEAAEAELVVSYSTEEGVLVCGATRKWKEAIKASRLGSKRFRFSRNLPGDCGWYIMGTRDKPLELAPLEATAAQLRAAGASVDVKYTAPTAPRSFAEREAERAERAGPRVERLEARAERLEAEAAAGFASARTDEATTGIPFGQPILVGHHSERKHRRTLERAERAGFKALETSREAKSAGWRAKGAARRKEARTDPGVTQRRIGRLEAELRKVRRNLHGHPGKGTTLRTSPATGEYRAKLEAMDRELDGQIKYWAAELGGQLSAGTAREWGPKDFAKGNIVLGSHGWAAIRRVNKTTLTVDYLARELRPLNPAKLPYDRVERAASGPVEDSEVRRKFADYFAKAAPVKKMTPAQERAAVEKAIGKPGVMAKASAARLSAVGKVMKRKIAEEATVAKKKLPSQAELLAYMKKSGDKLTASTLAYAFKVSSQAAAGLLKRLVARGDLEIVLPAPGMQRDARGELYQLPKKKAAKKKAPRRKGGPTAYPTLAHHNTYHWGTTYQHSTAAMQAHPDGYTVSAGHQGKLLKTQAGAEKWLRGIIGPNRFDAGAWLWVGDKALPRLVKPGARLPSTRLTAGDRAMLAHLQAAGEQRSVDISQAIHGHSSGAKLAATEDVLAKLQAAGKVKKRSTKDRGYYRAT